MHRLILRTVLTTPREDYLLAIAHRMQEHGDELETPVTSALRRQKDFTLYFDKESGVPVKQVAKVVGFQGQEYTAETTFADYKDFDGIKKATKVEIKRDGEKFQVMEVTEFKVLDKVDPETFAEPK